MKSQDLFILLKLISLDQQTKLNKKDTTQLSETGSKAWVGWTLNESPVKFKMQQPASTDVYSNRALETSTGVSKSEVNASIKRSMEIGMVKIDERTRQPKVNITALLEFITHGIKYVYPAKPSAIRRGIPTSFAAPVLQGEMETENDDIYIWSDAMGKERGQTIEPLYKTVPMAVKKDSRLYAYLVLVDTIRLGDKTEGNQAAKELAKRLRA
jgi:hypothetical protein